MDILPKAIDLPDFSPFGYRIERELGRNPAGGRVVYLAHKLDSDPPAQAVVIKHFRFLKQTRWDGFRQIEREVAALQRLHHRGIPLYLGTFETDDGFCLVQEYLPAVPLSQVQGLSLAQIEDIARQVLDILIYLQTQQPPIVHRDIKPENLLWDENENVYLIDFGFARLGLTEASASSMAAGTFGFMAPEQLRNRELTLATDLYGLGATLICLLADLPSTSLDALIDEDNRLRFRSLLPNLPYRWFTWLEGMVAPKLQHRFANAQEAKRALTGGTLVRLPKVKLPTELTLTAETPGEVCIGTLNITNTVTDSILQGQWSVLPHPSDPANPPDRHPWIAFAPATFTGFFLTVRVAVDTGPLRLGEVYQRYLVLTTNAEPSEYRVLLTVTTAPLPALAVQPLSLWPWLGLAIAGVGFGASCGLMGTEVLFALVVAGVGALSGGALGVLLGSAVGSALGLGVGVGNRDWRNLERGSAWGALVGGIAGGVTMSLVFLASLPQTGLFWPGIVAFAMVVVAPIVAGIAFRRSRRRGWPALWLTALVAGVSLTGIGVGLLLTAMTWGLGAIALGLGLGGWGLHQPQRVRRHWQQKQDRAIPP